MGGAHPRRLLRGRGPCSRPGPQARHVHQGPRCRRPFRHLLGVRASQGGSTRATRPDASPVTAVRARLGHFCTPAKCRGFKVEPVGLEPATSWVRYRPKGISRPQYTPPVTAERESSSRTWVTALLIVSKPMLDRHDDDRNNLARPLGEGMAPQGKGLGGRGTAATAAQIILWRTM